MTKEERAKVNDYNGQLPVAWTKILHKQKTNFSNCDAVKLESDFVEALKKQNGDLLKIVEILKSTIEYEV